METLPYTTLSYPSNCISGHFLCLLQILLFLLGTLLFCFKSYHSTWYSPTLLQILHSTWNSPILLQILLFCLELYYFASNPPIMLGTTLLFCFKFSYYAWSSPILLQILLLLGTLIFCFKYSSVYLEFTYFA